MLEALFDSPLLRTVIIFFLVLALIFICAWLVRWIGAERLGLGTAGGRGRQVRLAVIEDVEISGRRRLILIRRDNVEHLLMIGGPTDVVVEPGIVRAAAAREATPAPRPATAAETLPRPAVLGEGTTWPSQAEPPAARPPRIPMPAPATAPAAVAEEEEPELAPAPPPPPAPRRQLRAVDPLAGLAAELSRPSETSRTPAAADHAPGGFVPREPARQREAARERELPSEREGREPVRAEREPVRERELAREPVLEALPLRPRERDVTSEREREMAQIREPVAPPEPEFNAAADQNLADMAQRLEAALRRPGKVNEARPADPAARAMTAELESAPRASVVAHPRAASPPVADANPPRAEQKPGKSVYDSLEKEMASLLGRPGGKS
jgi:flagellar protein FliO/FliZ